MSPASEAVLPRYGFGDELASSVIHGIGILLSVAGLVVLVMRSAAEGRPSGQRRLWRVAHRTLYGIHALSRHSH